MTFLLDQFCESASWREQVDRLLAQFPMLSGCNLTALGVPNTL